MACLQGSMNSDGTGFIVLTISRTRFKQVLRTYCFFLGSYKEIQDLISTLGGDMEMICILMYHIQSCLLFWIKVLVFGPFLWPH